MIARHVAFPRVLRLPSLQSDRTWLVASFLGAVIAGKLVSDPAFARIVFAAAFLAVVVAFGLRSPRRLLLAIPVWLIALGLVRRLLAGVAATGPADPLLLVGPFALIVLAFAAADRGAFRERTLLSKLVLLFSVATVLGALNPLQGSMVSGVTGLIFFVPLIAFWIGRGLVDTQLLRRLLLVAGTLAVPAALYGMRQTFVGFPSWDQTWINATGYTALAVGNATRPFSSFSSASEYATFLAIAIVVWLQLGPRGLLRPLSVAVASLLFVAVFYQSSRGTVVMLVAGAAVMLSARRRLPLGFAALAGATLLLLLPAVVSRLAPATFSDSGPSSLIQHQVEGLSNPLDPEASTAGAHFSLLLNGVGSAFREPLGHGISAVTIAGSKFGGITYGTETDPSNAAVALGLPGLVIFLLVLGVGFTTAYRIASGEGEPVAVAAVGILTVTALQWLNGGQYAVSFLPWLLLGWVDATHEARRRVMLAVEPGADGPAPPAGPLPRRPVPAPRPRPAAPERPASSPEPERSQPAPPNGYSVYTLERLLGPSDERRYLLLLLRQHASSSGVLPGAFDELVLESFPELRDGTES